MENDNNGYDNKKKAQDLLHQIFNTNSSISPHGDSCFGELGLLIFSSVYNHYYYSKESSAILDAQISVFEEIIDKYSVENPTKQTLATGFLSFGIVYHFLRKYSKIEQSESFENNIDDIAFSALKFQISMGNLDYLYGATGVLHYILKHSKNPQLVECSAQMFINFLKKSKITNSEGIMWEDFYFRQREQRAGINLGLAHGMTGIIKVLLLLQKKSTIKSTKYDCASLIYGVSIFFKEVALKNSEIVYPYFYLPGNFEDKNRRDTRLAWCYGDLSNAVILLQVGKEIQDGSLIQFSNEIIKKTLKRKLPQNTRVEDAGLCHGSSGVFYLYDLLKLYSDDREIKDASTYWLNETFNDFEKYSDKNRYRKFNPIEKSYEIDYSLLEGSSGIGMSLISYLTGDRYWDYLLLLND